MSIIPRFLLNKLRISFLGVICIIVLVSKMDGQTNPPGTPRVVQISGKVVTKEKDSDKPVLLPYVVVAVKGTNRGTYTDLTGFFSIVVRTDETLVFSVLGYKNAYYPIPDTLTGDYFSIVQILYQDTFMLPVTVIYPWPDPDNFTQEFLAMDVHDDLEDIAAENVSPERMQFLRDNLPSDGPEHTQLYLKEQNKKYYYEGQIRPQQIFNAFAWKEFIDAWKRGDFKKKK
ncbi:MAG TPA: carboxypeptidase-like regulatory domain-containing protein [Saprospiraceae bacterium]|nr:carboxypeptidase-like regulatory domain-containing protein [Saprospiraceae bacterium]